MKTQIYKTYSEFLNRKDKTLNGVSGGFAASNPDYEKQNETNEACWNCSGCSGCYDCYDCFGLKSAAPVVGERDAIPVIPNIHATILAAASQPGALKMSDWHKCDTKHCRAGWAVHLAGEAGKKLEKQTSTLFAAMQIYHASSPNIPVPPTRFFVSNDEALKDMERCAAEEASTEGI